jgi:hypothetical protein
MMYNKIVNWFTQNINNKKDSDSAKSNYVLSEWDNDLLSLLETSKKIYEKNGADTKEIDRLVQKIKAQK